MSATTQPAPAGHRRALGWAIGLTVATVVLVMIGTRITAGRHPAPGFMCYWSAATLLAQHESPYDLARLKDVQLRHGWDKNADGFGFFEYLANYYPPSLLSAVTVLLVPLGFTTARVTWMVLNFELLVLAGVLLRRLLPTVSPRVTLVLVPMFGLSLVSVLVGQVTALVLFSIVAVWTLLERRADRAAGFLLAWMTIKPPLTALLVLAILVRALVHRRWRVLEGFGTGLVVLLGVSIVLVPTWPVELLTAMRTTPFVTAAFPWIGTTWLLVLRSLFVHGPALWVLYALLALPFVAAVVRFAASDRPLADVVAMSLLAAFFFAPTARPYDQPLLLIPLLVLIEKRGSDLVSGALLFAFLTIPYVQFFGTPIALHVWFFWIPAVLAATWLATPADRALRVVAARDRVRARRIAVPA